MNTSSPSSKRDRSADTPPKYSGFWERHTQPHSSIKEPERRRVRLLSSLLLTLVLAAILAIVLDWFVQGGRLNAPSVLIDAAILAVFYRLSRSRHYNIAAIYAPLVIWVSIIYASIQSQEPKILFFLNIITLIVSLFLSPGLTILASAAVMASILLLPFVYPVFSFQELFASAFSVGLTGAIATVAAYLRLQDSRQIEQQTSELSANISELMQGRKALQESESRLSSILDNATEAIISIDTTQKIILFNKGAEKVFGYQEDEILGKPLDILLPSRFVAKHEELVDAFGIRSPASRPMGIRQEVLGCRKDGTEFPALVGISSHIESGQTIFTAVLSDITERKQAEQALRESEEQYRVLFNRIPAALYRTTPQGQILDANSALVELLGYPDFETLSKVNVTEIYVDPEDRSKENDLLVQEGIVRDIPFRVRRYDGSVIWVKDTSRIIMDASDNAIFYEGNLEDITEQKQSGEALRRSEEKYRDLVENLNDAIFTLSRDDTITYMNPAVEQILGYKPEELIGKPYFSVLHPEELEETRRGLEAMTKNDTLKGELVVINREGEVRWAYSSIRPILSGDEITGYQGVLTDITERMIASQQIERQLLDLRALHENGLAISQTLQPEKIGAILIDTLAKYLNWNHVTIRLCEEDSDRLLLVAFSRAGLVDGEDSYHSKHFANTVSRVGQGLAGYVVQTGEPIRTDEVSSHPEYIETQPGIVSGMYMPIKVGRKVIGVISVESQQSGRFTVDDERLLATLASQAAAAFENARLYQATQLEIAERKQIERELDQERAKLADRIKERTAELVEANMELARANRLKDEFLSTMSHELRTPLNAILSLSESLEEGVYGAVNRDQINTLSIIQESGGHLLTLINDILDISKMEAGKVSLEIVEQDIQEICSAALRLITQQAFKKAIKISYQKDPKVEILYADGRRLKQILVNLLTNAVKFTPEGGEVGLKVSQEFGGAAVRFSVWDTGMGIKKEDLPRLFQPFVQLDSALDRRQPGTGLGLALVKNLVEMHGGSVGVESVPGEGSHFYVILPVIFNGWGKPVDQSETDRQEPLPEQDEPPKLLESRHAAKILIAEDNFVNYKAVSDYLQAHEFEVIWAANGREAIDLAEEYHPDLILMDIQMPELDGLEAIRRLRLRPDFSEIPIIALTALTMPGDRERFLEAGADNYMAKPIHLKELIQLIRRILETNMES